jgi:hypothetical protein
MILRIASVAISLALISTTADAFKGHVQVGKVQAGPQKNALPPAEFDVPYTGDLTIWIVPSKRDLGQYYCSREKLLSVQTSWAGTACTYHSKDKSRCSIFILKNIDHLIFTMRHELGHCNGWGPDHAGKRMVYMDEAVKAPELPKTTKTLRAYPPLVCLTPDGKEESGAARNPVGIARRDLQQLEAI